MLNRIFLFTVLILIMPLYLLATEYFVDGTSGNNSYNGLTADSAWSSIAKANSMVQPGDVVFIMEGTYGSDPIDPGNSGTDESYITYKNYPNHEVILTDSYILVNLSNTHYIIVDGINLIHANYSWINLTNSRYCTIQNVYCFWAEAYSGVEMNNSKYCKILNSSFHAYCDLEEVGDNAGTGPFNLFWIQESSYNLLEGNDFGKAMHYCISCFGRPASERNIFRKNRFHNEWHGGLGLGENSIYNIVEENEFFDHGEEHEINYCGTEKDREMDREKQLAFQLHTHLTIIRKNIFVNNGRFTNRNPAEQYPEATDNILFNNVFYGQHGSAVSNTASLPRVEVVNCAFGENIIGDIDYPNPLEGMIDNNNFSDRSPVEGAINSKAISDPKYVDKNNRDFHLQPESELIDAGRFLSHTLTTDSGTVIRVDQPMYFTDGYGLIEGDLIQLEGQTKRARILNVDFTSKSLYVDTYLKWEEGQGITLAYNGSAPDIGAYEYGQGNSDSTQAYNPNPSDGLTKVDIMQQLTWNTGSGAQSHNIYFGNSPQVEFVTNLIDSSYDPGSLEYNETYYWRIDEVTENDTITGNLWSFTTADESLPPEIAFRESPANSSEDVNIKTTISWKAGRRATSHDLYFGTTNPPDFIGNRLITDYEPGDLELNTQYYWRIDEINEFGKTEGNVWTFKTQASTGLPEDWASRDIGLVGNSGSGFINESCEFTINGSGADIYEMEDAFHFVYYKAAGSDLSLVARVVQVENSDPWAKAGVMIRKSLEPGAVYAMMMMTLENGLVYQKRSYDGGATERWMGNSKKAPYWVKIIRGIGKYFVGYESADGSAWKLIQNQELTMGDTVYLGLAVSSVNNDSLCTAIFDNVILNGEEVCTTVAIDDENEKKLLPKEFNIQNYPNPFNPTTNIQVDLPHNGNTSLVIYDVSGRKIKTLLNGNQVAGIHLLKWDATNVAGNKVASGVYFYRVQFKNRVKTGKMLLMR